MININDLLLSDVNERELWWLVHIAKRINKDAECWPSNATQLKDTGWKDVKALRKIHKSLEEKGIIEKKGRANSSGAQVSNLYQVTTPFIGVFVTIGRLQGGGTSDHPGGGTSDHPRSINHLSINNVEKNLDDVKTGKIPYSDIITYLNDKAGRGFKSSSKATREKIKARWNEGFRVKDFHQAIDAKVLEWKGTPQAKYLRPETLFGPKMEGYVQQYQDMPTVDNSIETMINIELSGERFDKYHSYHKWVKDNYPKLFATVPIIPASTFFDVNRGGKRFDLLRIHWLEKQLQEKFVKAHKIIEAGLSAGNTYESVTSVLNNLYKVTQTW